MAAARRKFQEALDMAAEPQVQPSQPRVFYCNVLLSLLYSSAFYGPLCAMHIHRKHRRCWWRWQLRIFVSAIWGRLRIAIIVRLATSRYLA